MQTLAILPIKRFSAAKQRRAGGLEPGAREVLAEAMVRDVLSALSQVRRLDGIVVVTSEPRALAPARAAEAHVIPDAEEAGQSAAVTLGIEHAEEIGVERVLLVPGDCPALHPGEVDELLVEPHGSPSVVIVPDRHGTGTNALLLSPPGVIAPAFGEGSFARHEAAARAAGLDPVTRRPTSLLHDVDTSADLEALQEMRLRPRARLRTSDVLAARAAKARVS